MNTSHTAIKIVKEVQMSCSRLMDYYLTWLSECEWLTVPTCPSKAMAPATHPLPCATRGCRTCIVFP